MSSQLELLHQAMDEVRAGLEETMQEHEDQQNRIDKLLDEVDEELERYDY